jgi:archaetidylinositol phosphate synthase
MNIQAAITKEVDFTPARRLNQALTASLEKRALKWMVGRAPHWLTSDQLTMLGLSAQIGAGVADALSRYNRYTLLLVILCLVLNWFGDSMDVTLPPVRRRQRPRYASTLITWWTSSVQQRFAFC